MLRLVDWSALPNLKIVYSNEMRRNFVEFLLPAELVRCAEVTTAELACR